MGALKRSLFVAFFIALIASVVMVYKFAWFRSN